MNKLIKFLKVASRSILASTCIIALFFAMSCDTGSDPEPELYDLSGVYTFKEALLTTPLEIPGISPLVMEAFGNDITSQMAGGLLAEAPCNDPANGAVELKADHTLFFACIGETVEDQAGTWSVNGDTTELNLNLSVSTGNLQLKLQDLEIDEVADVIGGSVNNFPINKSLVGGFLVGVPGADAILAGIDDTFVTFVGLEIEFQKVTE